MNPLRIGTRGSKLALWQAQHVRTRLLNEAKIESEIIVIKTAGDQFASAAIPEIGGKGIFIKEIEDALLDGRVDAAVHSMKDVPTATSPELCFPAILQREDPRDCLVSRSDLPLEELKAGVCIGTSSLRRQSQLLHFRSDLKIVSLRGNVDTRLKKLDNGEFEAMVVAKAGLERLGLSARVTQTLPPEVMLSAVGQGALAIEVRECDARARGVFAAFDDADSRAAVNAERALLAELEGGCQVPLGAWARVEAGRMRMDARVLSVDGTDCLHRYGEGAAREAEQLGRSIAREMLDAGAARLLGLAGRSVGGP